MQHATGGQALATSTTSLNPSQIAALAYLGRYSGHTRKLYELHLRLFFEWCAQHQLDPLADVQRIHVELFVRHLEEDRGNVPSTIRNRMAAVKGYFRFAAIDGLITRNPAEYAHIPRAHRDNSKFLGLDRLELGAFIATSRTVSPQHQALGHLLALLGLRISEACAVQIEDYAETERGHRVLHLVGKGNKPATMPLTVPIIRALENAQGDRTSGPLLTRKKDGQQLDRATAACMVATIAKRAGIRKKVTPHTLRRSAITNALDAGIPLRDVQILARHSDPRVTMQYDVARGNWDRHGVHILSAYVAGAA